MHNPSSQKLFQISHFIFVTHLRLYEVFDLPWSIVVLLAIYAFSLFTYLYLHLQGFLCSLIVVNGFLTRQIIIWIRWWYQLYTCIFSCFGFQVLVSPHLMIALASLWILLHLLTNTCVHPQKFTESESFIVNLDNECS
jgi:hypothetical protein